MVLPESAAARAAAIPAGPAPTTATSNLSCWTLFMGFDFHVRFAKHLATAALWLSVDCDAAFEARAHAAERRARLAGDGSAASCAGSAASCAGSENCHGNSRPGAHAYRLSIHANDNGFRHAPPQSLAARADTVEWESPGAGREFARRSAWPSRVRW